MSFFIFKIFAFFISRLSFKSIYRISNVLYFYLFKLFKYREKVVCTNLKNAFPEKSESERMFIMRQFYKNLTDIILETIKIEKLKEKDILNHISIKNPDLIEKLTNHKMSILVVIGHFGNWEWYGLALPLLKQKALVATKPLSNKYFENYLYHLRKHFSGKPVHYKQIYRNISKHKSEPLLALFAADQSPAKEEINFKTNFLNQPTAFYTGIEKIAKQFNLGVIYAEMNRIKRGQYEIVLKLITDNPQECDEHTIINKYICYLEESIRRRPDHWLWSHKRWKHINE